MSTLALYESMAALSAGMAAAAGANDWERLVELERDMAALRDGLMRSEPAGLGDEASSVAEEAHKAALIETILENEREVMRHVTPQMESLRKLLSGSARDRAVRAAYGAFGP